MKLFPIVILYFLMGTCQKSLSAKDDANSTACFGDFDEAGNFKGFICNGKPVGLAPGPKGDKGERGPGGPQGPQGPAGDGGRTISELCKLSWPNAPSNIDVKYLIFTNSDGSKEAFATISQPEGIFSNSTLFLKDEEQANFMPLNVEEFSLKLVSANQAHIRNINNGRETSFSCQ